MNFNESFKDFLSGARALNTSVENVKELDELQEALNNSTITAKEEEQQRCTRSSRGRSKRTNVHSSQDDSQKESLVEKQSDSVGRVLHVVYHEPVFEPAIPYNKKFSNLSIAEKVKLMIKEYDAIKAARAKLAARSKQFAPWPTEEILSSPSCTKSLRKRAAPQETYEHIEELPDEPTEHVYVSQKGRQVKRKIYTEDLGDSDSSDFMCNLKKIKADSDLKLTMDTSVNEGATSESANQKKPSTGKPLSRTDIIFDELKKDQKKEQDSQITIKNFYGSLSKVEDDESDHDFVRHRVQPVPYKKGGRGQRGKKAPELEEKNIGDSNKANQPKTKRKFRALPSKETILSSEASTSLMSCPICENMFAQDKIEQHAANCGTEDILPLPDNVPRRMTCDLCDRVLLLSEDYDEHTRQCIGAKPTNM